MRSPVIHLRIPETLLQAIDAARGEQTRSSWLVDAIGLKLSPVTAVVAAAVEPDPHAVIPVTVVEPPAAARKPHAGSGCKHKHAVKGWCRECGTGGHVTAT